MRIYKPTNPGSARLLVLSCLLLGSVPVLADTATDAQPRQDQFQKDRQACLSGASNQSRQDCLHEAGAVLQQGGQIKSAPSEARLQANAEQRCAALPEAERSSCLLRMRGEGHVSGSVGGGGLYRELTEPMPPLPASPPAQ